MRWPPRRYQCPKCRWDFAVRKKRCCPGCGTLLLIASDNPTDAELTEWKSFWMWEPVKEGGTIFVTGRSTSVRRSSNMPSGGEGPWLKPRRSQVLRHDGFNETRFRPTPPEQV